MSIGPDWGDAHIDVHADTSPLRRELRAAAATAGKEFGDDFGKSTDRAIQRQMTGIARNMESQLGAVWRRQGDVGSTNFAKAFADGIKRKMNDFDFDIVNAGLTDDWSKFVVMFGDLDKAVVGVNEKFAEMRETSNLTTDQMDELDASFRKWTKGVKDSESEAEFDRIRIAAEEMNKQFDRDQHVKYREGVKQTHTEMRALHVEINKMLKAHDDEDRSLQRLRDAAHKTATEFDRAGRSVKDVDRNFSLLGRLKGSRNNFLNIVGAMSLAMERFGDKALTAFKPGEIARSISDFTSNFRGLTDVFKDQGFIAGIKEFGTSMQGAFGGALGGGKNGGISGAIIGIVTGLIQMAQAIAAVVLAIGSLNIIAPIITGLGGIITALAGSVAFAVAGFLLPLGPMALAAAAGVGALVVAFVNAGDEVKKAVQPFKDWFKEIQKPVQEALFKNLTADMDRFKSVLNGFVGPLLIAGAEALSAAFTYMSEAFQRPEVQNTLNTLGQTLPAILGSLGKSLTDFLTGLLGFFAPISVATVGITENIANIAAKFSEWANSTAGQESIGAFFTEASASAQILWDLVLSLGSALGTLFAQGKATGDQFLQKIIEIINKFTEWANSEEGRQKIASWMAFAKDLAGQLWSAIEKVGSMIAKLDTPANRAALLSLLSAFGQILEAIGKVAAAVAPLAPAFQFAFRVIGAFAESAADMIGKVASAVSSLVAALHRITVPAALSSIFNMVSKISGVKLPYTASGGVFGSAQARIIGEAGPEAVVPLNRPLSMVDPSVRWLSAIAQGKGGSMASQGSSSGGRSIVVQQGAFQVVTPTKDPALVSRMVLDGLVARIS